MLAINHLQRTQRSSRRGRQWGMAREKYDAPLRLCGAQCATAGWLLDKVPRKFATTHRKANQSRTLHVQLIQHRREIVGECIVVVTGRRMTRLAKPAAVVGNNPVTSFEQRQALVFK